MSTWGGVHEVIEKAEEEHGPGALDFVRRNYLAELNKLTKRNTILYGSAWLQKPDATKANLVDINEKDVLAFMECVQGLSGDTLDLILHSPGGYLESAEHIVKYLREHFSDIRIIVPYLAMSAATLIACSANQIVLGKQSALGPIDPQFTLSTQLVTVRKQRSGLVEIQDIDVGAII